MRNKAIPALAAILLLGSAAAWYWWGRIAPSPVLPPPVTAPAPADTSPAIRNPLPAATGSALPELGSSDAPFGAALTGLPGARALTDFLRPENLVRHLVATVDNLPRHRLAVELRPLQSASGSLLVSGGDLEATLDERNGTRYAALTAIVGALNMRDVNNLYRQYYPLFQRAYEDLGYPKGYFNDRLVEVIDDLLATPRSPARWPWCGRRSSGNLPTRNSRRARPARSSCCGSAAPTGRSCRASCASCARWSPNRRRGAEHAIGDPCVFPSGRAGDRRGAGLGRVPHAEPAPGDAARDDGWQLAAGSGRE